MDKQVVTIYDVAHDAGVSMATVSRVINKNTNVKPATRDKVNAVIEKLHYRPNAVARGLASKRSATVGVILPDLTNAYLSNFARGTDDVANLYNYNLIMSNTNSAIKDEAQVVNDLLSKQIDGLIYMGKSIDDKLSKVLIDNNIPTVVAGGLDTTNKFGTVNIDYNSAEYDATDKLLKDGKHKVAFVSGSFNEVINKDYRLKGYKKALKDNNTPYDETLVFRSEYNYDNGLAIFEQLKGLGVNGVVVTDDELAVGILNAATDGGVKVPEDFEIIANNDTKLTRMSRPMLSSIEQPMYDVGAVAMRLLTKFMHDENVENKNIVLDYKMVYRDTTK